MKIIIVILAFIVVVQGSWDELGCSIRFEYGITPRKTFFYKMPTIESTAIAEGWTKTDRCDDAPMQSLDMYCYSDHVVCLLFDDTEHLAGVQIGITDDEFSGGIYDWAEMGYTNWTTTVNGTSKSMKIKSIYFCSEETLAKSQEERLAEREERNETLQEGFFLINGFNNELMQINKNASDLTDSNFTKQGFLPWMGRHYYYNMSSTTECSGESLLALFPLVSQGKTIGVGIFAAGVMTIKTGARNWFETPNKDILKLTVPHGSQCMYDLVEDPGMITMHIYFVDEPWLILSP